MDVTLLTMKVSSCLIVIQENETNECAMAGPDACIKMSFKSSVTKGSM